MKKILEIKNLTTQFEMEDYLIKAVDEVDLTLHSEETLGIAGESGCGKSVLSLSIMGLLPMPPGKITQGEILYQGENLLTYKPERMRTIGGKEIAMIFQEPMTSLNPLLKTGEQIAEALIQHKDMDKHQAWEKTIELLDSAGIPGARERAQEYPFQFSGGMRQRVMIAMAIACDPRVLIADEPTTALDVTIQSQILRLLDSLKQKINSSLLFITHDMAVMAGFADRIIVLYAGKVMENASVTDLFKNPLHPYTQGLLKCIPLLGENKYNDRGKIRYLHSIKGNLPDPRHFPKGCPFEPRCPFAMGRCQEAVPPLLLVEKAHEVRCYLHE
ncbi:MAG: ABC transporter ATP-binding protein [Spirochaetales bacterium]|nr:ABC transporter ATP-binding protein [Spirochaetales bacterium]